MSALLCAFVILVAIPFVALRMLVGRRIYGQVVAHWIFEITRGMVRALRRVMFKRRWK